VDSLSVVRTRREPRARETPVGAGPLPATHKAAVVNEYRVVSKSDLPADNPGGDLVEQAVDFSVRANVFAKAVRCKRCRVGCGTR
jgi:hypothetical protein